MLKKVLPVALAALLLAGCGSASRGLTAPTLARTGAATAQSKLNVDKGIRVAFAAAFKQMDKNNDGLLSLDEMQPILGHAAGTPEQQEAARRAAFELADVNHDQKVTLREFTRPEFRQPVVDAFRQMTAKAFADRDANGDHMLSPAELQGFQAAFEVVDRNGNGKVSLSEYEDACVDLVASGQVVPAPAPQPVDPQPQPQPVEPQPAETPQPQTPDAGNGG